MPYFGRPTSPLARCSALPHALAGLTMAFAAGGCRIDVDPGAEVASSSGDALAGEIAMTCSKLTLSRGRIGAGQTAAALAEGGLTGEQDEWDRYVEFAPRSSATCEYTLPAGTTAAQLASLSLGVNYLGPAKSAMRWTFEAWDAAAGAWVVVGDNTFARSWTWTNATLNLPAPYGRFVSGGALKIRYATSSSADSSALDQLILKGTTTGGGTTGGGTTGGGTTGGGSTGGGTTGGGSTGGVWTPAPGTTWQWQLTGTIDTSLDVAMYDIDLFDAPQATIDALHTAGKKVVCYFSGGSYEEWRSDASRFPAAALGRALDGWPGERWLDTRSAEVREIMKARLDLAKQKRCDGVEPDNVDGYDNRPGFPLTAATQLDYNRFLAAEAHARGLSIGLKNDLAQVRDLVGSFDWALNEECYAYDECDMLTPFIRAGKAVFHAEYVDASQASAVCAATKPLGLSTVIKQLDLDAWRVGCP
ncbi:endo alpha-1,4 polygalactosaminidase [Sorangium sp. So ce131]|uniref:endo alpha-1,4 polygalactosaminidase n=1 Tax=Sorangium sp. So ce131 TaxID=3133282 RepID=UPI003F60744F